MNHNPLSYRPDGTPRWATPADVCDTCSTFDTDPVRLVPVAFCPPAKVKTEEFYAWLGGYGPRPPWVDTPDAATWTPALQDHR